MFDFINTLEKPSSLFSLIFMCVVVIGGVIVKVVQKRNGGNAGDYRKRNDKDMKALKKQVAEIIDHLKKDEK